MAAHFSRASQDWTALLCLVLPFLLLHKKRWVKRVFQFLHIAGGYIWVQHTVGLVQIRADNGLPWVRLAVILAAVALFTAASALIYESKRMRRIYDSDPNSPVPGTAAFILTAALLTIIRFKVGFPVLLLERFLPGSGWIEVALLALYASWLCDKMFAADEKKKPGIRSRLWTFFSIVFFLQFFIGLAGIEEFLMTGKLHLPVPAMILAGPFFRGEGFFMLVLFLVTVLLTGPAWCSFLCYIGAWDNRLAALKRRRTASAAYESDKKNRDDAKVHSSNKATPGINKEFTASFSIKHKNLIRVVIFFLVVITALILRWLGASAALAAGFGLFFGLMGVGVMVFISRKKGIMTHCVIYCPIGLAANLLGRLSPFRLRIGDSCSECSACAPACRYDALTERDIKKRRPGLTCTLCGDCRASCKEDAIQYRFFKLKPRTARMLFYVLVITFHAVFLGVARI